MAELEKVNCSTPDLAEETARKLLSLLPECAGENGEVDLDKLRQCLSSKAVEGNVERYEFTWPGKRAAKAAASVATSKTLRPCREESVDYDVTRNLYIEGDNLEVLKLLQTSYAGQVKMIYIDPPYNTGHDFVYRDRFSLTQKELDSEAGVFDEDGNRFEVNDSAEARYHSNWCSMMWPRLKLARNLLRDDGVIFISIDDNEVTNARRICDEIFGESNFIDTVIWKKRYGGGAKERYLVSLHEYALMYSKNKDLIPELLIPMDLENAEQYYAKRDEKFAIRGGYRTHPLEAGKAMDARPNLVYPIPAPDGSVIYPKRQWLWSQERTMEALKNGDLEILRGTDGGWVVSSKQYMRNEDGELRPGKMFSIIEDIYTQHGTNEMIAIFGNAKVFSYPKPSSFVKRLLLLSMDKEALILDFFSGSATTAHAVMQLNAEDGGHRRFIMVQLPEPCSEDSEAAKAGYKNICEIGKERIRRAGKKIAEELAARNAEIAKDNAQGELGLDNPDNPVNPVEKEIPDIGFRVLKLDSSSLLDVGVTTGEAAQETLALSRIREDRSPEDLLFQILLETRIPLSDPIRTAKVGGNEVFFVGCDGEDAAATSGAPLVACLDPKAKMDTAFFLEIAKLKPEIAFFRDDAFADDSARTNLSQIFTQFSRTTSIKVL